MADKYIQESGIKDFNKDLEANIKKLEKLSGAADKASDSINRLEASYNRLVTLAEDPVNFKINGARGSSGSRSRSGSSSSSSSGSRGSMGSRVPRIFTGGNKGKSGSNAMATIAKLSNTAAAATKPINGLMLGLSKLGFATGGTVAAVAMLAKITADASKNSASYARSLNVINESLSKSDKRSLETANKLNVLNNRMSNLAQGLGELLSPVLDFIVDLADIATSMLPDSERKDKKAKYLADVSSSAHQSGLTMNSSKVLGSNTYKVALGLTDKFNQQASEIADKLAKAWMTGSDAAKEYGVVLNDNVLTGYMWSKGIDIANVEITDAMKQYYRYQLMVDQTSGKVTDSMIKDWTSLGYMIDKTKGKLFSFDEVIQLTAADPTIPDISGRVDMFDGNTGSGVPPVTPMPKPLPGGPAFSTSVVVTAQPDLESIEAVTKRLDLIPKRLDIPILVPDAIPATEALEGLNLELGKIRQRLPIPVNLPVYVPGFEYLPQVQYYLENIPNSVPAKVNVSVVGLNYLSKAYSLLSVLRRMGASFGMMPAKMPASSPGTVPATSPRRQFGTSRAPAPNIVTNSKLTSAYGEAAVSTGKKIAAKNGDNWNSLPYASQQKYTIIGKNVNANSVLGINDGVEMYNSYNKSGTASTWWQSSQADTVGNVLGYTAAGLATAGSALLAGPSVAGAASTAAKAIGAKISAYLPAAASVAAAAPALADGGIGTKETFVRAFEGNKSEAIIPLETNEGIEYLANAMSKAGAGENKSGDIVVNLTLSGLNLANNDAEWERVGRKIGEVIDVQRQRRGALDYGSSF